jgi:DNA-binding transcriptional LysR family regulator
VARTDPLSIRQIEVFVALVEQGSFTSAARHLQLSQSTVSGHIADLERRLGVRLVERERQGVRLTPAGDALIGPAREVLQAERTARMSVDELAGLLKGSLAVGGSTIPASYILPGLFARFHAEHPAIRLLLRTGDSREILECIRGADLEIGVVGAPPGDDSLQGVPIGEDRLVLVVAPGHPLAGKRKVRAKDLLDLPLVTREEGSGTRVVAERALAELLDEESVDRVPVACEVGSTEALKAAVRAGLGMAFVSDLAVRDDLEHGALRAVELDGFRVGRPFYLVSRAKASLSPAARAFRDLATAGK